MSSIPALLLAQMDGVDMAICGIGTLGEAAGTHGTAIANGRHAQTLIVKGAPLAQPAAARSELPQRCLCRPFLRFFRRCLTPLGRSRDACFQGWIAHRLSGHLTDSLAGGADTAGISLNALRHYLELRKLPEMIDNIHGSGMRATAIVKNMLGFARKSDSTVSSYDMCDMLDQTIELLGTDYAMKKQYDFKKIKIEKRYDEVDTQVACEAGKIQQVFLNLLKNGAEAMAGVGFKDGDVQASQSPMFNIRVKADDAWVQVEIEDNGPGMDAKTCASVFEPFFTTKPMGKGTGLGLSVSYFIITEDHNGEMMVESQPGVGSKFIIRLPVDAASAEAEKFT